MEKAESLLTALTRRLGIEDSVRLIRIKENWHGLFAVPLSLHMFPAKLSKGELLLNVDSPVWMQQLSYHKQEISSRLRSYGVREVRFRIGRIPKDKPMSKPYRRQGKLSIEDTSFMDGLLSEISDEGLRDSVKKAVEKSLRSRKLQHNHTDYEDN